MTATEDDVRLLQRAVDLATTALDAGDDPFGSLLVAHDGTVLAVTVDTAFRRRPLTVPGRVLATARVVSHEDDVTTQLTTSAATILPATTR